MQSPEQSGSGPVDPAPRPTRRSFTAEYKAAIVAEYEAAPHGEKSAVLRREGLFHSHVQEWSRAGNTGVAPDMTRSSQVTSRLSRAERETERLRAENARLNAKLAQTQAALSIMGKAHELLASLAEGSDTPPSSSR
jgi:transposase-like protein